MKKILYTLALLCALAQGAWAEDVKYIYYKAVDVGNQASLNKFNGTVSNPTVLTSKLLEDSPEDNLGTGWYVLNSSFSYLERIVISGDVHLILCDGCTLTAEQGIRINTDATLSIYAQSETVGTMGKLVAIETHHDKAAIGGNKNYRAGTLAIHGGEIEATCKDGSKYAAGIGGGYGDGSGMKAITIYGGKVTAQGAYLGAGIGGGKNNNYPGHINIYGGTVNATGGGYGAGIGGGENRAGWNTNVYGGNITAKGGDWAAGIGGGEEGGGGNLHFYGGTVNATSGGYAAGIGAGEDADGGTIIIDGGNITATGTYSGPGIGGGSDGDSHWIDGKKSGTITINGGTVVATGSYASASAVDADVRSGAAIGSGNRGIVEAITITGGNIKAYANSGAAGIGGGNKSVGCGVIKISGGTIYAESENNHTADIPDFGGPGIGAGSYATGGGEINISGTADIEVVGGKGAAAIGCGNNLQEDYKYNISITGGHIRAHVSKLWNSVDDMMPMLIGLGSVNRNYISESSEKKCATVTIADGLSLWAGNYLNQMSIQKYTDRIAVCTGRVYGFGDINTHTDHGAFNYTLGESTEQHVAHCGYCGKTEPAENHTNDGTGKCEKCGYGTHTYTVKVYKATGSGMGYGEGTSLTGVIPGQKMALPDINQSNLPAYMVFEGWLKDPATAPTTWEKTAGETLLAPGAEITPDADVNLYARYSYHYGTEWTWTASSTTASATLKVINLEDNSVVKTFTADDVAITASPTVNPTKDEPGHIFYGAEASYTDDQGRNFIFTDDRTQVWYLGVELDEDDNTTTLADNDGGIVTATLTSRTLYKDDKWNTLCLPFDVEDISGSPLKEATVKEFTDAAYNAETGTLTLTFADATSIKAGQAYLIKWEDSGTILGPSDLVFTGVTLAKDLCDDEISTDDKGTATVAFLGTYKKLTFDAADQSILFLGAGNTLYYPQSGATIGAQRAYFKLNGITAGDPAAGANVRAFVLDFGDEEEATGIDNLTLNSQLPTLNSDTWYTLDGRRLSGKPTTKGIYLRAGKKVMIQ